VTRVYVNNKFLGVIAVETTQMNNDAILEAQKTMVNALAKPGCQLQQEMTPTKAHLNHMLIGLCGEVGEIADCIKKYTMYRKALDVDNLKEEIGDLLFYTIGICNELNIDLFECMVLNQAKLAERYKSKTYSDQAAIERADKQGE
jgi:NTP pyrophosphatase (non-canonical NTP hydrolase)